MALSSIIKNFRDGTITLEDATGTPISMTLALEAGDFSVDGFSQGVKSYETTDYTDRGEYATSRKTNQTFPSFSLTAHMSDLSDATDRSLFDIVTKGGAWASGVSTLGPAADVWAIKITLTIEGTDHGDSADHVFSMDDCICEISFAEGDPNSFSLSGRCVGTIAVT